MTTICLANCTASPKSSLPLGVQCALFSRDYLSPCQEIVYGIVTSNGNILEVKSNTSPLNKNRCRTTIKIISYLTIILPLIAAITFYIANNYYKIQIQSRASGVENEVTSSGSNSTQNLHSRVKKAIDNSSQFNNYKVRLSTDHRCYGMVATAASDRVANLFYNKLFEGENAHLRPNRPGSSNRFRFPDGKETQIREFIQLKAETNEIISVNASGKTGSVTLSTSRGIVREEINVPLDELYGSNTFEISFIELWKSINSQIIYLAPELPKKFFLALKEAMTQDRWESLPQVTNQIYSLKNAPSKNVRRLVNAAEQCPMNYDFQSHIDLQLLINLTLYQIGSLVVKIEDLHLISDTNEKIIQRSANPEKNDTLKIITACGIREINSAQTPQDKNPEIITSMIQTALVAADSGFLVLPAIGMGAWGGPPEIYWNAILKGIATHGTKLKNILICPGHQKTKIGQFLGRDGNEFQEILDNYKATLTLSHQKRENLDKIINLYKNKTDMLDVARKLKAEFPDMNVTVLNASNPDVTLGNRVTQNSNMRPHHALEENIACKSLLGLGFAGITGVLSDDSRVISRLE